MTASSANCSLDEPLPTPALPWEKHLRPTAPQDNLPASNRPPDLCLPSDGSSGNFPLIHHSPAMAPRTVAFQDSLALVTNSLQLFLDNRGGWPILSGQGSRERAVLGPVRREQGRWVPKSPPHLSSSLSLALLLLCGRLDLISKAFPRKVLQLSQVLFLFRTFPR